MANNPLKYSDFIQPDDSIAELIKQLEQVQSSYEKTNDKLVATAKELDAALKKINNTTAEGQERTRKAASAADELSKSFDGLKKSQSETAKQIAELKLKQAEQNNINKLTAKLNSSAEGSYNRLSAQYALNKVKLSAMSKEMRESTKDGKDLEEQTKNIYEEMKKMQSATGQHQLNVGNYPDMSKYSAQIKEALGLNTSFGDSLSGMLKAGGGFNGMLGTLGTGVKALGSTMLGLMSNPVFLAVAGISAAGAAFKFWFDYNKGLVEATRLTQLFTNKSGEDLKNYRTEVQVLADTYGKDFREMLVSVNAVSKQFGIEQDEALKLVRDGFIAGADANEDFLENLKEYPAFFAEAGVSASQFIAITTQANKAGIYSDKGIDAIKEGNTRLREMTSATASALDAIGISSSKVQKDLQAGTKTTFQVMQEVSAKLNELPESSRAVGTAIADVFGGPGEDAGLQYLKTLKDIDTNLDSVKEKAGKLGHLQEEQIRSQTELAKAVSALFDSTGGVFETLTTSAKVFANDALASVLRGIIGIINYVADLYNKSIGFRLVIESITTSWNMLWNVSKTTLTYIVELLKVVGTALHGAFTLNFAEINKAGADFAKSQAKFAKGIINGAVNEAKKAHERVNKEIKPIVIPVIATTKKATESTTKAATTKKATIGDLKTLKEKSVDTAAKVKEQTAQDLLNIEQERQAKELGMQREAIQLRLYAAKKGSEEEIKIKQDLVEKEREIALFENAKKPAGQQQDAILINAKFDVQKAELNDEFNQISMLRFDNQQALAASEFELLKTTEGEKTRFKLEQEKERLQKILELNATAAKKLSDTEVKTIQNTIEKIDKQITASEKDDRDIYSMVGLKLNEEQKAVIEESTAFAIGQVQNFLQAKVDAAQAAVEAADEEVEAAQTRLDAEIESRNAGYASNVAMAQKELDQAKKNQEKALNEQEKAQKAQKAIETLQQVSSLVTATAGIWKSFAGTGPWGIALAVAGTALMWGSFAAAKIKASQLTKKEYGEGGVEFLDGGSHASGNDIQLGYTKDGKDRRAEGGEALAIIRKTQARRYRKILPGVISALNRGVFEQKYINAYDTGGLSINVTNKDADLKTLEADVQELRKQGERRYFTDGKGRVVETYKNLRRTYNVY